MDYREYPPLDALSCAVNVAWTLRLSETESAIEHLAVPDGCIEVISRRGGSSHWQRPQPACFVAGLIDRPARLRMSGPAQFVALRLWPWTWSWLCGAPLAIRNDWIALEESAAPSALGGVLERLPDDWEGLGGMLARIDASERRMAQAALDATGTSQMAGQCGASTRACQRWFVRHAGLTPRSFRRLRRFEQAWRELQHSGEDLAAQASAAGFADQAHMAREFRRYAQQPASRLRGRLRGPFVDD